MEDGRTFVLYLTLPESHFGDFLEGKPFNGTYHFESKEGSFVNLGAPLIRGLVDLVIEKEIELSESDKITTIPCVEMPCSEQEPLKIPASPEDMVKFYQYYQKRTDPIKF